jgi:hypothetical protein
MPATCENAAMGNALFPNAQWPSLSCKSHQQSDGDARQITGHNLWEHMNRGTLTPRMLKAAGNKYRQRANQFCR